MDITVGNELRHFNALLAEINNLYHEAATLLGLSDSALYLLYSLAVFGDGIAQHNICNLFGISRQTIHSCVSALTRQGLVELHKGKGRERSIFLTEKGRKMVEERIDPLIGLEKATIDDWTPEEWQTLLALLGRYRDSFRAHLPMLEGIVKDGASVRV